VPLEHEELTGHIIGAAIEVHVQLGPGFLESIYENALALELRHRGLSFVRQQAVPVLYRGVQVGCHRLDLFVADQIVVEIKNVKEIQNVHFVIVRSYLRAVGREHGLLVNFSQPSLEVRRVRSRKTDRVGHPGFLGSSETPSRADEPAPWAFTDLDPQDG